MVVKLITYSIRMLIFPKAIPVLSKRLRGVEATQLNSLRPCTCPQKTQRTEWIAANPLKIPLMNIPLFYRCFVVVFLDFNATFIRTTATFQQYLVYHESTKKAAWTKAHSQETHFKSSNYF